MEVIAEEPKMEVIVNHKTREKSLDRVGSPDRTICSARSIFHGGDVGYGGGMVYITTARPNLWDGFQPAGGSGFRQQEARHGGCMRQRSARMSMVGEHIDTRGEMTSSALMARGEDGVQ